MATLSLERPRSKQYRGVTLVQTSHTSVNVMYNGQRIGQVHKVTDHRGNTSWWAYGAEYLGEFSRSHAAVDAVKREMLNYT